jgi:hypothetical protein
MDVSRFTPRVVEDGLLMEAVLDVHARGVRIKKFIDQDVVMMHLLQKGFMEKYMCWYANKEPYVPHDAMIKRMIESTSNANKVHGVVDDNSNSYRNIIMNAMNLNLLFSKYTT